MVLMMRECRKPSRTSRRQHSFTCYALTVVSAFDFPILPGKLANNQNSLLGQGFHEQHTLGFNSHFSRIQSNRNKQLPVIDAQHERLLLDAINRFEFGDTHQLSEVAAALRQCPHLVQNDFYLNAFFRGILSGDLELVCTMYEAQPRFALVIHPAMKSTVFHAFAAGPYYDGSKINVIKGRNLLMQLVAVASHLIHEKDACGQSALRIANRLRPTGDHWLSTTFCDRPNLIRNKRLIDGPPAIFVNMPFPMPGGTRNTSVFSQPIPNISVRYPDTENDLGASSDQGSVSPNKQKLKTERWLPNCVKRRAPIEGYMNELKKKLATYKPAAVKDIEAHLEKCKAEKMSLEQKVEWEADAVRKNLKRVIPKPS